MKLVAIAVLLSGIVLAVEVREESTSAITNRSAKKALQTYEAAIEKAEAEAVRAETRARERCVSALSDVMKEVTMAGDLDEALAIRAEKRRLEAAGRDGTTPRVPKSGTYDLEYSRGNRRQYVFTRSGITVNLTKEELTRRRRELKALKVVKTELKDGRILARFDDTSVERWTFADDWLFVEHWGPVNKHSYGRRCSEMAIARVKKK